MALRAKNPSGKLDRKKLSRLRDEKGFALFLSFLLLLLLGSLAGASLMQSTIDLKTASHYRAGSRAFMAGEAGALHAVSVMNTTLVWDIQDQLASSSWTTQRWLYGETWHEVPGDPAVGYTVLVAADPTDPDDAGTITATGIAPGDSNRVIRLRIRRTGMVASPGAIYLVNEGASATFNGNAFGISGNDHTLAGAAASTGIVKPGISTRNDAVVSNVKGALNDGQKDNVVGLGYKPAGEDGTPADPSVLPASGPNGAEMQEVIDRILANASVVDDSSRVINGNCDGTYGTLEAPQITHLVHNVGVIINGDFCGAGILIADSPIQINGSMNFTGWIIALSKISMTGTGDSMVRGSVWTNGIEFGTGGSMLVEYSTEALELANGTGNYPDGNVPRLLEIASWEDL